MDPDSLDTDSFDLLEDLAAQVIVDLGGSGGVEVVWRDVETGAQAAHAIFQVRGEEVWWQDFQINPPWQRRRMAAHMSSTLLKTFRDVGVKRYVIHDDDMVPANDKIYTALGFEREGDRLVASIAGNARLNMTAREKL